MQVISCPGLRITHLENDYIVAEHPLTGDRHLLNPPTVRLLHLLQEPEELDALCGEDGPVPQHIIEHLLSIGLLVDASAPFASMAQRRLRRAYPTFMECPEGEAGSADVCVIGMPYEALSETGSGTAAGPASLRLAASMPRYEIDFETGRPAGCYDYYTGRNILAGVTFADLGDIIVRVGESPLEPGRYLREVVQGCLDKGSFPLILGGDHSLTAWSVKAETDAPLSILQLDAHSDMGAGPNDQTPTNASVARRLLEQPGVKSLLSVGVRGFLPIEQTSEHPGHKIVSTTEARRMGAEAIVNLLPEDLPCYVTFDVDALDPTLAPGTNTPVPNGLTFEEVRAIMETVGRRRRVIAADVVEVNPARDPYLLTARAAAHLALTLLGACFEKREKRAL